MHAETGLDILPGELADIAASVFATMLHLGIRETDTPWFPDSRRLTAVVYLTGDWNGAVALECSPAQACRFAARFLSGDPSDAVDDVVRDVIGELANMIGGNLKCALTTGIRLSMPSVIDGDYGLRVCRAELRQRLAFDSDEGPFWIAVLATRDEPGVVAEALCPSR